MIRSGQGFCKLQWAVTQGGLRGGEDLMLTFAFLLEGLLL